MRRRIKVIIVFLLLGAIVNVAVAWGCSLLSLAGTTSWVDGIAANVGTPRPLPSFMTRLHGNQKATTCGGTSSLGFDELSLWDSDRTTWVVVAGWPLRTLWGGVWQWNQDNPPIQRDQSGILWTPSEAIGAWIPKNPIWSGVTLNTLFYALVLCLIFFAPFTARRIVRRRRGLCEKCAYPIGVSPVCTECSAAVPRKVEASFATS